MKKIVSFLLIILSLALFACQTPHEHKFVNGACECGEKHNCVYVEGVCECGALEPHTHEYGEWEVVKEATETEEGLKERTCECGEKQTEKIEKLTHTHVYSEKVVEPTCTEKGYTEYTCSCGESYKDNYVDVKAHIFGEWEVVKEASETEEGLKERTCECGEKQTEKIEKLAHVHKFENGYCSCGEAHDCVFNNGKCECGAEYVEVSEEIINAYLEELYLNKEISEDIDFVERYLNTKVEFEFYSSDEKILSSSGKFTAPILDKTIELSIIYYIDGEEYASFIPVICKGWGTKHDVVELYLDDVVPAETKRNFQLPLDYYGDNTVIKWYMDGNEIENGMFTFERTLGKNYNVVLKAVIDIDGIKKTKDYTIRCMMLDSQEKVNLIFEEYNSYYDELDITESIVLPTYDEDYGASIYWRSYNAGVLDVDGTFNKPFNDIEVKMMVIISAGEYQKLGFITFKTIGEKYNSKLDKIEYVLDKIHKDEILTHKYYLFGCEAGYERVLTKNIGYVPFVLKDDVKVTKDIIENGTAAKPDRKRTSTNYITLHNTGMAHESATAKGLNDFIHKDKYTRQASWHFSIDDYEAYQHVNLDEVAWHAGDGSYRYGDVYFNDTYQSWSIGGGNNNSIGIEICVYKGCDFNSTMRNVAKLVGKLLVDYKLTPSDVRQHYDFSGKNCPQVLRESGRWPEMLELIAIEYFIRTELSGVEFEFTSLTPEYLDNDGKIIKNDNTRPEVSYKVNVKFDGQEKEYIYKSILLPL